MSDKKVKGKSKYESPILVPLGEIAKGSGVCAVGSSGVPAVCTTGTSVGLVRPDCVAGTDATTNCTAGTTANTACSMGTAALTACSQGVSSTNACTAGNSAHSACTSGGAVGT
jgi:hypothetical protein